MGNRIIKCDVSNEFIKGAGQVIGAAGSHDDVELELTFSPVWYGTSKRVLWLDALGENPTLTVLTTDLRVPGQGEVYRVPVPAEAKAVEGDMMLTIRGVEVEAGVETRAVVAATAPFRVLPAIWDPFAEESQDITPNQADQLQAQIDNIKNDIDQAAAAASSLALTKAAQQQAELARDAARDYAGQSAGYLAEVEKQATDAANGAEAALQAAEKAEETLEHTKDYSKTAAQEAARAAAEQVELAKEQADRAQSEAERVTVPPVEGVYNIILQDRGTGQKYVLLLEDGLLCYLPVRDDMEATRFELVDGETGASFVLGVEAGKLYIEEVI